MPDEARRYITEPLFAIVYKPFKMSIYPTAQCRVAYNNGKTFEDFKDETYDQMIIS